MQILDITCTHTERHTHKEQSQLIGLIKTILLLCSGGITIMLRGKVGKNLLAIMPTSLVVGRARS